MTHVLSLWRTIPIRENSWPCLWNPRTPHYPKESQDKIPETATLRVPGHGLWIWLRPPQAMTAAKSPLGIGHNTQLMNSFLLEEICKRKHLWPTAKDGQWLMKFVWYVVVEGWCKILGSNATNAEKPKTETPKFTTFAVEHVAESFRQSGGPRPVFPSPPWGTCARSPKNIRTIACASWASLLVLLGKWWKMIKCESIYAQSDVSDVSNCWKARKVQRLSVCNIILQSQGLCSSPSSCLWRLPQAKYLFSTPHSLWSLEFVLQHIQQACQLWLIHFTLHTVRPKALQAMKHCICTCIYNLSLLYHHM